MKTILSALLLISAMTATARADDFLHQAKCFVLNSEYKPSDSSFVMEWKNTEVRIKDIVKMHFPKVDGLDVTRNTDTSSAFSVVVNGQIIGATSRFRSEKFGPVTHELAVEIRFNHNALPRPTDVFRLGDYLINTDQELRARYNQYLIENGLVGFISKETVTVQNNGDTKRRLQPNLLIQCYSLTSTRESE